jgi:hypothetical protein
MSIPVALSVNTPITRGLSDRTFPVLFGTLINLTGIGTTYVAAGYSAFTFPSQVTGPIVSIAFTNTGTSNIFISFDGVNDNIIIPAGSNNIAYDLLNNRRGLNPTGVWARSSAAGGSIFVSYLI